MKTNRAFPNWYQLAMLTAEANTVIAMRMLKLSAGGPKAQVEAQRMVTEKIGAAFEAAGMMMMGGTSTKVVRRYRRHVKGNRRRLGRR